MATNITYDSLLGDMGAYIERARVPDTDAWEQRPRIVNLAERSMIEELKLQGYEKTLRGTMQAGKPLYPKPDRWRETISMHIEVNGRLVPINVRAYEYCVAYWPDQTETGQPKFYCEFEGSHHLIVGPPDQAYPWIHKAYLMPKLLDEGNQTNWLTDQAPVALQWRVLKEMAQFLKKAEDVARFGTEYTNTIGALAAQDAKKIMDRAAERDGV